MKDWEDEKFLHHEVKKIWKGVVSCGDYTLNKCLALKKGLALHYGDQKTSIPYELLEKKQFKIHDQTIQSKFGQPYKMVDFGWKPDENENEKETI